MSGVDWRDEIVADTRRPVAEGVWFAYRNRERNYEGLGGIRNGVWWVGDSDAAEVSKAVSLAEGTGLHAFREYDYETYGFEGVEADDVCCHDSFEAAEHCALHAFATNKWCDYEASA